MLHPVIGLFQHAAAEYTSCSVPTGDIITCMMKMLSTRTTENLSNQHYKEKGCLTFCFPWPSVRCHSLLCKGCPWIGHWPYPQCRGCTHQTWESLYRYSDDSVLYLCTWWLCATFEFPTFDPCLLCNPQLTGFPAFLTASTWQATPARPTPSPQSCPRHSCSPLMTSVAYRLASMSW